MKKQIKVTTPDGKSTKKEIVVRDYDHFLLQLKYRTKRMTNKKIYKRRSKHAEKI